MGDLSKIASAVVALGTAAGAAAAPVTVSQSLSLNQLLTSGSTTLQFDLSATLASQGLASGNVLSGHLVVYGVSDAVYSQYTQYGNYQQFNQYSYLTGYTYAGGGYYVCTSYSWWSGNCTGGYYVPAWYSPIYQTVTEYQRTVDNVFSDATVDTMVVAIGSSSASATDTYSSASSGYTGLIYETGNASDTWYRREQNTYQGYSGSLSVTQALDLAALAGFGSSGTVSGVVSVGSGQFRVTGATLTVQVDDAPPSGVPEPTTLALVAVAGTGVVLAGRRRRGNK